MLKPASYLRGPCSQTIGWGNEAIARVGDATVCRHWRKLVIDGDWADPALSSQIQVINASSAEPLGPVAEALQPDIDVAVGAARTAFDDRTRRAHWEPHTETLPIR